MVIDKLITTLTLKTRVGRPQNCSAFCSHRNTMVEIGTKNGSRPACVDVYRATFSALVLQIAQNGLTRQALLDSKVSFSPKNVRVNSHSHANLRVRNKNVQCGLWACKSCNAVSSRSRHNGLSAKLECEGWRFCKFISVL